MSYVNVPSNIGIGLLGFGYQLGSDFEQPGKYGTSHLMEHLMCKSFNDMLPQLKKLGVDNNAYTSHDKIVFHFHGLYESLKEIGQTVYNKITDGKYKWSEQDFNTEKNVVLQEYGDRFNNQTWGAIENICRKHFNYYGAIGLKEDIENFTYQDSLDAIAKFNKPYLYCEVGDRYLTPILEPEVFNDKEVVFGNYDAVIEKLPKESKAIVGLVGNKTINGLVLSNKLSFVNNCLNDGLESPLSQEIRDKRGLSYGSWGFTLDMHKQSVLTYCAVTTNEKAQELKDVYSEFFNGDISRHISKNRFNDCLNSFKIQKKLIELLPHKWGMSCVLGSNEFEGMDDISYEEVLELANGYCKNEYLHQFEY